MRVSEEIALLKPYQPGKPIAETKREYGLSKVIKLASNESPIGVSEKVKQAIINAADEIHRYPDASCFELKQMLAKYYKVSPDQLVFGNGSNELIDLIIRVFCAPSDICLSGESSFIAYKICSQAARVTFKEVPLTESLQLDLDAIAQTIFSNGSKNPQLVFIPNPNNPTGTYVSESELVKFIEKVKDVPDLLIVLDEAYCEFVRAKDYPDSLALMKKYPNIMSMRTLSKVYGLAGLRLGVLIGAPKYLDYIDRVRNPFNVNSLAQVAAQAAVADEDYLARAKKVNWDGLDYFYKELTRLGIKFWKSEGNFVLFDAEKDANVVYEELLKLGLILRPVKGYGLPTQLRMSVGLPEENKFAIECIEKVMRGKE